MEQLQTKGEGSETSESHPCLESESPCHVGLGSGEFIRTHLGAQHPETPRSVPQERLGKDEPCR